MMDIQAFGRLTARIRRAIAMLTGRAAILRVDDTAPVQLVQISLLDGEVRHDVDRMQNYGVTSVPLAGMEAAAIFVGGDRDHGIVVAVGDRSHRLKGLSAGEVALYDHLGKFVHLKDDGTLHIKAPRIELEAEVEIKAHGPRIEIEANSDLRLWAGTSYRIDVHGYAKQLEWVSGTTWLNTEWVTGATISPTVTNAIEPPKVDDV